MAGKGPLPKHPDRRARAGRGTVANRVLAADSAPPPPLPRQFPGPDGVSMPVPTATRRWWRVWVESPLSASFTAGDWSELLDTALIHARFWSGEVKLAPELRLRVARFGATPEDRARLRITFAQADSANPSPPPLNAGARERYGHLTSVADTNQGDHHS